MITTHIKYDIEQELISKLGVNNVYVYDEEDPLFQREDYHITLYSVGGTRASGRDSSSQDFDIEVRGKETATSKHITERVAVYLQDTYAGLCILPTVPSVSNRIYRNCRIINIGNISNLGKDAENKIVFRITATILYNKENN